MTSCRAKEPADPNAYQTALELLKQGKQKEAEKTLDQAIQRDPKNQRLLFFKGACARSRWMKREALPIFDSVSKLNPTTPEGKCATLMVAIDTQQEYKENFEALETLQKENTNDVLILWMSAVACRELGKRDAPRIYSEKGAKFYAQLLDEMNPGPVLLHQTYANILSEELGRHEEALKHRKIALRLEPAPWSHQGMANTLSHLGRYAEADTHYQQCIELAPNNPTYLTSWAWSMGQRGNYKKAFELYEKAAKLAPNRPNSWKNLGWCATKLNQPDDAKRFYAKAEVLKKKQN